ncbi:MAG: DUF362 domain-containing protein [Terriglobia bacterium]|jgi:uncharacterized protein (DUF362 family)
MNRHVNRREFIQGLSAAAAGFYLAPAGLWAKTAPTAPVAVAKCATYGPEVGTTLATMFDQLGGIEKLVRDKTVAMKINVTGSPPEFFHKMPVGETYWVHPQVVGSVINLLGKAGARRIRLVESPTGSKLETLQEFLALAKWNPTDLSRAASGVEFDNTNWPGPSGKYKRFWVPNGGLLFKAYDMSRAYEDCDVFVSLAKLKEHSTAGVTLSMKNCFGNTPTTIYGDGASLDEPSRVPQDGRGGTLHEGKRQPPKSSLAEIDPHSPREPGYRVPRVTADLVAARPIHLAIIDGIETVAGGEGPWVNGFRTVRPGLLVAGTNCVTTDAVCTALMGFDPMADRGTAPFETCDSTLKLAEQLGVGTRDLSRIEVRGLPIEKGRVYFRKV